MANLRITETDFFEIKENLKNFLKQQDEFKDYDFSGSGLQVLLDILSSNTYYNSIYQNMIINESFLDSAILRESVVSKAKMLGYTPRSMKASQSNITLYLVESGTSNIILPQPSYVTVPQYSIFGAILNNTQYIFTNLETQILNSTSTFIDSDNIERKVYSANFDIFQGIKTEQTFDIDYKFNPDQRFIIPNNAIDLSTLIVKVKDSINSEQFIYELAENVSEVRPDDRVFWIIENESGNYELEFGNGRIGKKLIDGSRILIEYLVTEGSVCNRFKQFSFTNNLIYDDEVYNVQRSYTTLKNIEVVSESFGGDDKESTEEIKFSAPKYYESQNRAVTSLDYRFLIENKYKSVDSVKTWGGEDNVPPEYGKVFISLKPKSGYFITDVAKESIKNDLIKDYNVVSIDSEIVDPYYTYITIESKVKYNLREVPSGGNYVKNLIFDNLKNFNEQNLGKFDSFFRFSKLVSLIDSSHDSIKSNLTEIRIKNKINLFLDENYTYFTNFNNSLVEKSLRTSTFNYLDNHDCFMEDDNGKISIYHTEYGIKKLLKKNVGIVDYEKGTVRLSNIVFQTDQNVSTSDELVISFEPLVDDLIPYNNQIFVIDTDEYKIDMINVYEQILKN